MLFCLGLKLPNGASIALCFIATPLKNSKPQLLVCDVGTQGAYFFIFSRLERYPSNTMSGGTLILAKGYIILTYHNNIRKHYHITVKQAQAYATERGPDLASLLDSEKQTHFGLSCVCCSRVQERPFVQRNRANLECDGEELRGQSWLLRHELGVFT